MNSEKKFNIPLISILGVGIVLTLVLAGILALQRSSTISEVRASPGPECKVEDDLKVTRNLSVLGSFAVAGTSYGTVKNGSAWVRIDETCVANDPGCAGSTAAGDDRGCCACYHHSPQGKCLFTVKTTAIPSSTSAIESSDFYTCYTEFDNPAWAFCVY